MEQSPTLTRIEQAVEGKQGSGLRRHLGASLIGRPCNRFLWYVFRWAFRKRHKGRILRLFDRGNREEEVFVNLLRKAGIHTLDRDPETGKQFRISDFNGHFGGSLDAKLYDAPEFPLAWLVGEFKTHGDKSFKELKRKKVKAAKYEHFVQAQFYTVYEDYPGALYFAVNKNTDEMHVEFVEPERELVMEHRDRAGKIIAARTPPERIANSPGSWLCKFCDAKEVCHLGAKKLLNCRTCIYSQPITEGRWFCERFHHKLTHQEELQGCQQHVEIPET